MGAPYTNSLPQYWHIGGSLDEFRRDLPHYIGKIGELDRIQLNEYADLKAILPVLWEEVLQHHPSTRLRFYGHRDFDVDWIAGFAGLENLAVEVYDGTIRNLEKLAGFPNLQHLMLNVSDGLGSLNFLNGVNPQLQELYLCAETKSAKSDLSVLTRFRHLKTLSLLKLEKNLDKAFSGLDELETLMLRSISKPQHIDFIGGLKNLQFLTLQLCGFENMDAAAQAPKLKYLEMWRLPKLKNLDFVSRMQALQFLSVETLNGVTRFPEVSGLTKLRRVEIDLCKNLTDFGEVAHSRSIREFSVQNTVWPDLAIYLPIIENRHIEKLGIGHAKAAMRKAITALAQKHGRGQIAVCKYPGFGQFVFE